MGALYRLSRKSKPYLAKIAKPGSDRVLARELAINYSVIPNRHDGFAQVVDWGIYRQTIPFIVIEFVDGVVLNEFQFNTVESVIEFALAMAKSVGEIHANGFVHGDLSPRNVMILDLAKPVLIDFGLSAQIGSAKLGGTDQFTAPDAIASQSSDIYSYGKLVNRSIANLERNRHITSERLNQLKCLAADAANQDPNDRPKSTSELVARICEIRVQKPQRVVCYDSSTLNVNSDSADSDPWHQFVSLSSKFHEYVSPDLATARSSCSDPNRQVFPFEEADKVFQLIQDNQLVATTSTIRKRQLAEFLWAYATQLERHGNAFKAATAGELSAQLFMSGSPTSAEELLQARRFGQLSLYYTYSGQHLPALVTLLRSTAICRRLESAESPVVARALNNLGDLFRSTLKSPSIHLHLQAKAIWLKAFGPTDNQVAWVDHNIARIIGHRENSLFFSRFEESQKMRTELALMMTQRAFDIKSRILSDDHSQVAYLELNLAQLYSETGNFSEADIHYSSAVNIRSHWFGYLAPATLAVVNRWAESKIRSGRFVEAYKMLNERFSGELLSIWRSEVADLLILLAFTCGRLRKRSEQQKLLWLLQGVRSTAPSNRGAVLSHQKVFDAATRWIPQEELDELRMLTVDALNADVTYVKDPGLLAKSEIIVN